MRAEHHLARIRESLEMIEDAVTKGAEKHQRTIGFHASAAALDMLQLYLGQEKLVTPGAQIQHQWFRSQKRAREVLAFEFPQRDRIIQLLYYIEKDRDALCYGRPCSMDLVREVLERFNELREIFSALGLKMTTGPNAEES